MKRLLTLLLLAAVTAIVGIAKEREITPQDYRALKAAIALVDQGMSEAALPDFDRLASEYPDNYLVQYEKMYTLYTLGRYDDVVKIARKLMKHREATPLTYQMCGNAFDLLGNAAEARKTYAKGLKKFPDAGMLYLETGNLDVSAEDYNAALKNFNKGIDVEPNFASNYYRAAELYFASENFRVWGLIYAEAEILLAPSNRARHRDMGQAIKDCFLSAVTIVTEGEKTEAKISLVPSRNMSISTDDSQAAIAFDGIYEACVALGLAPIVAADHKFTASIPQMAAMRQAAVEAYFEITDNLYGNAMYLLPFQKKIIDAGHWEAYNYFIFSEASPEEFEAWHTANSDAFDAFVDWYNNSIFRLDATHTVGIDTIYRDMRQLNPLGALLLQASLLHSNDKK